jgi:hypothetical protein
MMVILCWKPMAEERGVFGFVPALVIADDDIFTD